jgi:hypothetical protein
MSQVIITILRDELANFPENGREDVIYFDEITKVQYQWNGTNYVALSGSSVTNLDYNNNFLLMGG